MPKKDLSRREKEIKIQSFSHPGPEMLSLIRHSVASLSRRSYHISVTRTTTKPRKLARCFKPKNEFSRRPQVQQCSIPLRNYTTHSEEPNTSLKPTVEEDEDRVLRHEEAVTLMLQNELIKNDTAYDVFKSTDPANFSFTSLPESIASENLEPSINEEEKKVENEAFMDNWLHSALVVIGIVSVMDAVVTPGSKILDLACGNGYMAVILAKMVKPGGKVIAIDFSPEKLAAAKRSVETHYPELLPIIEFREEDVFSVNSGGPFDAIHVGGGLSEVPQNWLSLLRRGGCLLAATPEVEPESNETHYMLRKYAALEEGGILPINLMYVNFEPLQEPSVL